MRSRPLLAAGLTVAILLGCSGFPKNDGKSTDDTAADSGESGGDEDAPAIQVTPTWIDFDEVEVGGSAVDTFRITSVGATALTVDTVTLATGAAFSLTIAEGAPPYSLEPGAELEVEVVYTRLGDSDSDTVSIASDDPDTPTVTVDLVGPGGGTSGLTLDPDSWDAGAVAVGDVAEGGIRLIASGSDPVVVESIQVTGTGFDEDWSDSLPLTLVAGDDLRVPLSFAPPSEGAFSGRLVVGTDLGEYSAALDGEGVVSGGPVAVCAVDPTSTSPGTAVMFMGEDSFDDSGTLEAYEWTLVDNPSGSSAALPAGSGANRRFTPDVAGSYTAELVVTNDRGDRSDVCEATLEVVAGEDFSIQLTWDQTDDDMDLHFIRPGGTILDTEDDCHYANTNPDWGVHHDTSDDPELILDDIEGTGPEEIVIGSLGDSGDYEVWVDDYSGSTGDSPTSTNVTVEIYQGGALVYSDTRSCSRECADMHFADIDSATGAVTAR